ncbi:mitochondrial amidoxime-reducing component 1-like isoform X2 [Cyprinus carpio]|uniref:Mitochondrial amidoxime-reducing component 1-like isoform X1 n=1 Tax=Cyprinus carpio TaxID=7962 RepID=A0A9R0AUR2_CYPCA|nr:mitochondrial amidoxime-reducing component 1-like isoform X1 [Cyprinus carpio]XP_042611528.1 mitochondrial amidoxime-reducing component 1-like isoform X2 [Cyprinus carpio]
MDFKGVLVKIFARNREIVLCAAGTAVALLGLGLVYKYNVTRPEKKLTRVGVVTQLLLHPMKSGKAVLVETAECLRMGLKYGELQDRHWLVITEDGHMVTGRQQPRLVLVSLNCEGGQLCLNGPQMEELRVPLQQSNNAVVDCRVFSIDVQGRDCGDDVSNWLTRYLESDKTVRLVHYEPHLKAQIPSQKEPLFPKDEKVAYPDAAPIMLMSEASVRDLNTRLDKDVTVFQFRPSIVVSDCEAFTEDTWDHIQIGQVELKRVVGCGRCVLTTVDPETGIITRKEPLDTLKTYRLTDPKQKTAPILGQYYIVKKTGVLHVGEPVYKVTY